MNPDKILTPLPDAEMLLEGFDNLMPFRVQECFVNWRASRSLAVPVAQSADRWGEPCSSPLLP